MPWTWKWRMGYDEEAGRWCIAKGYNGAFLDHGRTQVGGVDKLDWINGVYIRNLGDEGLAGWLEQGFLGNREIPRDRLLKIIPLVRERLKTLSEFPEITAYLFEAKHVAFEDFKKVKKKESHEIAAMLREAAAAIEEAGTLETDKLDPIIRELAQKMDVKAGAFFMALRVAVTGSSVSPPLLESVPRHRHHLPVHRTSSRR